MQRLGRGDGNETSKSCEGKDGTQQKMFRIKGYVDE